MTTETQARQITAFDLYVGRKLPDALQEGAGIPASWTGDPEAWRALAAAARDEFRRRAAFDFAVAIGEQGYTAQELGSGQLSPGSVVKLATGVIKRPPRSKISLELERNARQARDELQARRLTVDAPLMVALEGAAAGIYTSEPGTLIGAIRAATAACDAYDREHEVAREETAAKVKVRVLTTAGPSRRYSPGVYSLNSEELRELEEWGQRVESQAGGRSLSSLGYKTWPAFIVEAT